MAEIHLNENTINKALNENDYALCKLLLQKEFTLSKNEEGTIVPKSITTFNILNTILERCTELKEFDEESLGLIRQCFISLQFSAACGKEVQNDIINRTQILNHTAGLFRFFVLKTGLNTDVLSPMLKFLSNLIINNNDALSKVVEKCGDLFEVAILNREITYIVVYIMYNLLKNFTFLNDELSFVKNVIILLSEDVKDVSLILELLVERNIILNTYNELENEHRIDLLEYIHVMQMEESIDIPIDLIKLFSERFKRKSDCILKTVTDYFGNVEPFEVTKLLDCVACASSTEKYLLVLQNDRSLLINCAFLLKSIHSAGKEGNNEFSAIQKLSDLQLNDSAKFHPAFGFKASLIRLLGNLCWKHKENQNLVRELDCIPLLMDCCNIDGRNPLIIQWVILAIRNLCEDNPENKSLIANISKVGVVDSATLREMGLTLNNDEGNKICIAPLELNK